MDGSLLLNVLNTTNSNNSTLSLNVISLMTTSDVDAGGAITADGNIYANSGSNATGCLHLSDNNGVHDTGICAPPSGTNGLWNLPTADGTPGQVLATNGSFNLGFITVGGGGGGGGATLSSQLADFNATYVNGTTVSIGSSCSFVSPCPVAFNNTTYTFTTGYTATLSGSGSSCSVNPTQCGTVRFYIDSSGNFNCATDTISLSFLSCSGGALMSTGVTSFPVNTLPQGQCTAISLPSNWDSGGCSSVRSFQRQKVLKAGNGIMLTERPTATTITDTTTFSGFLVGTSLEDFGGNCNGVFDNTTAFSDAIAAITANGGGHLILPAGVCITGTVNLPTTVPMWLQGQGVDATTIKLKASANSDLITQANFSGLTGSDTSGGIFRVSVSDMTLDGNKLNQSGVSWVLRTYGHGNFWNNLIIQNGLTGGRYTEYALDSSFGTPASDLEDSYNNVKMIFNGINATLSTKVFTFDASYGTNYVHNITVGSNTYTYTQQSVDTSTTVTQQLFNILTDKNATFTLSSPTTITLTAASNLGGTITVSASDSNSSGTLVENQQGDGFLFRGPHDTNLQNVISYGNTGWGFHNQTSSTYNGGAPHFFGLNTYTDTLGGVYNEDGMICEDCAFTTATGPGHLIASYAGGVNVRNGTWASLSSSAASLECRNANNNLQGGFFNSVADAVFLNGCESSRIDFNFFQVNGPLFKLKSSATNNTIITNGESTSSTLLFDPQGLQAFPATNCVQLNIQGPNGSLATKYFTPCVNSALQIDNTKQFLGVNITPQYPLDVQSPQPSNWTIAFSSTGAPPNTWTTGYVHNITVGSNSYNYTQLSADTGTTIAAALLALVNAGPDPNVTATQNGVFITLTVKLNTGALVICSASDLNGSTTLIENKGAYTTPVRFGNPTQNATWLFEQEGGVNYLLSMNTAQSTGAEVDIVGPSATALPQLYILSHNVFFGNQDATGVSGLTVQGATSQGTTPCFTIQTRAAVVGLTATCTGNVELNAIATLPIATSALPACVATTGIPWRTSVNDALSPTVGVALTGGGLIFANVHCSLTTGTYIVDGL